MLPHLFEIPLDDMSISHFLHPVFFSGGGKVGWRVYSFENLKRHFILLIRFSTNNEAREREKRERK